MADELALRRQCLADFRALVAQHPTLDTPAAHARLNNYIGQQTVSKGNDMPAKDYRTLGEDLINVAVRLPQSVIDQVDAHITTLRTMSPWARVGRSEALRDLILRGLRSLAPQGEPAPEATAEDTPLVQHETSSHAVHVAYPAPQADVVQAADTPAPTRARQTPDTSQTPRVPADALT
jgi:hypothetical protein